MTATIKAPGEITNRKKYGAFAVVMAGIVLGTLDTSIVNVSYPSIARDFGIRQDDVVWAGIVYTLSVGPLALAMGRLSDHFGHRRLFVLGFALFAVATAACGMAPDLISLCAARALQGAGYAMILGNGLAVMMLVFPPHQRGRAIGAIPVAVAIGISSGPVLGGEITHWLGWRWVFWVMTPFAALLCVAAALELPRRKPPKGPLNFDYFGLISSGVGVVCMILAMTRLSKASALADPITLILLAVSVTGGLLFLVAERRAKAPLVPMALVKDLRYLLPTLAGVLSLMLIFAVITLMPFQMEQLYGFDTRTSGRVLLISPVLLSILGPVSGWITDRKGLTRTLSFLGLLLAACAPLSLAFAPQDATPWGLALRMGMIGLGMGLFQTPNTTRIMSVVPKELYGTAGCLQASVRTIGTTIGLAFAGVSVPLFYTSITGQPAPPVEEMAPTESTFTAFRYAYLSLMVVPIVAIALLLAGESRKSPAIGIAG